MIDGWASESWPFPKPTKIIAVGLNYRDHAAEAEMTLPEQPLLFAKWPNALVGDGTPIRLPAVSDEVDFEAELAVVIGEPVQTQLDADDALRVVGGYTCLNDVSARDVQFADGQWTRGKSFDTFCPVGPAIVPAAAVPDPQALRVRCLLNGQVMQDAPTADMVFPVAELISFVSGCVSLEPGDLIATGTPPGVGFTRRPPRFLRAGDIVTVEIDGVGALTNPVIAA